MRRDVGGLSVLGGVAIALASALFAPRLATADQAPFWESPVGLTPGSPSSTVRMVAENVDIEVVEIGRGVYAVVAASFDMLNSGPDIQMKVGFPNFLYDVIQEAQGPSAPLEPVTFTPANLTNFRVWSDEAEYAVTKETIKVGGRFSGSEWLVWEMSYQSGKLVHVNVSYQQRLDWEGQLEKGSPWVQPMYVLRTGALWDGTIGEATITMSAPNGGVLLGGPGLFSRRDENGRVQTIPEEGSFLGADSAAEATETRLVWRLRDFKPAQDVGTTYLIAGKRGQLRDAEAALASGAPTGKDYLAAAQAALEVIGKEGPHGTPAAILERYPPLRVKEWAWTSNALLPDSAAIWEAAGDIEFYLAMPARKHHGELACWPANAADAYQLAVVLGSPTAAAKLASLAEARDFRLQMSLPPAQPCA